MPDSHKLQEKKDDDIFWGCPLDPKSKSRKPCAKAAPNRQGFNLLPNPSNYNLRGVIKKEDDCKENPKLPS